MKIAKIALAVPLDTLFDYLIPSGVELVIGARVKVPFGKGVRIGIVVKLAQQSELDEAKIKHIIEKIDEQSLFTADLWDTLLWASNYYHYPLGETLFQALPSLLRQNKSSQPRVKQWQWVRTNIAVESKQYARAPKVRQILAFLEKDRVLTVAQCQQEQLSSHALKRLQQDNIIQQETIIETPQDWRDSLNILMHRVTLNSEQQQAIDTINQQLEFAAFLLDGVTGSGKTEIYLRSIERVLKQGKQALVMVPEISLTPQTMQRFQYYFNTSIVMLHSGLSDAQRLDIWHRSKEGNIAIVIGTRSAIFTPFNDLGIIIIDEEHDNSYKQQERFRYNGRDLALLRSKWLNIPIVLGSATPSLESLYNVMQGKFQSLKLTQRIGASTLPSQSTIDLKGSKTLVGLSLPLIERIKHHLSQGNQALIFLNKRGFSPVLMCHECGWIAECHRCDHYFNLHQQTQMLRCHHCGAQKKKMPCCPKCSSSQLIPIGIGTERLEMELPAIFPNTSIIRVDSDTTSHKNSLEQHLAKINSGEAQLILGTQILAKGHHFPNVTLVALIDVDGALFSSDFRAIEHFSQLYTQVAGRAGRAEKKGEVILQTHHPEHPLLNILLTQGYTKLTEYLLDERKLAQLPPFSHQASITARAHNEKEAKLLLEQLKQDLQQLLPYYPELWLLGPYPATRFKQAGYYSWKLLLQHQSRVSLYKVIKHASNTLIQLNKSNRARWIMDIDPIES